MGITYPLRWTGDSRGIPWLFTESPLAAALPKPLDCLLGGRAMLCDAPAPRHVSCRGLRTGCSETTG